MWEPFSEGARRAMVRAQQVAEQLKSSTLGTRELAYALMEGDDEVARLLQQAIDLAPLPPAPRESEPAQRQSVFTPSSKRSIELGFANARRMDTMYIGTAHLALGILETDDAPPLRSGVDVTALRAELDAIAVAGNIDPAYRRWELTAGPDDTDLTAAMAPIIDRLERSDRLAHPGSKITLTVARPDGYQNSWVWTRA